MHKVILVTADEDLLSFNVGEITNCKIKDFDNSNLSEISEADLADNIRATGSNMVVFGPDINQKLLFDTCTILRKTSPEIESIAYRDPTPEFLVESLHSGIRDFVDPAVGHPMLKETISLLVEAAEKRKTNLVTQAMDSSEGGVITFIGPKGGVGKTSLAVNLAYSLAKAHPGDVALIDLDLTAGEVSDYLQIEPESTIATIATRDAFLDATTIKLSLTHHLSELHVLSAPTTLISAEKVDIEKVKIVIDELVDSFKYIVIDTGPGSTEAALAAISVSTDIIAVTTPEIGSVRTMGRYLSALEEHGVGIAKKYIVLNREDPKSGLMQGDIETILGIPVDVSFPPDHAMIVSANQGVPYMESKEKGPVVDAMNMLMSLIIGQEIETKPVSKGWFK